MEEVNLASALGLQSMVDVGLGLQSMMLSGWCSFLCLH